ncbi:unnamed protein product [Paramecium octaurelia]|uniref:Tetratricopeptide repeat protein n=1 Tax=Paramecium octaurelia TaxID=43137 RepID=A0A8S1U409_PAROT|nr:unnamed protein product [Paramecium octaurelia]
MRPIQNCFEISCIECYEKAISINPQNDIAWTIKGQALCSLEKYFEAIDYYDIATSINPKNDTAWTQKGVALIFSKYKDAIVCFEKAISLCMNPLSLRLKADSLFELGNKDEAQVLYLVALETGSDEKEYIQDQLQKL